MADNYPVLRRGMISPKVSIAQSILSSYGYYTYRVDEVFGPRTEDAVTRWQMTHYAENGRALTVNGVVDASTWWSLLNPEKSAGKDVKTTEPDSIIYKGLPDARSRIIKTAVAEWRKKVVEIPKGSNWGGRVSEYLKGVGAVAWCYYFLMWVYKTATDKYPYSCREGHVLSGWRRAKAHGHQFLKDSYKPIPGDEMVMLYRDSNGKLTGTGHVGLVIAADWKNRKFQTIEGNSGDAVKLITRNISQSTIVGFINRFGDQNNPPKFVQGLLDTADLDDGKTR